MLKKDHDFLGHVAQCWYTSLDVCNGDWEDTIEYVELNPELCTCDLYLPHSDPCDCLIFCNNPNLYTDPHKSSCVCFVCQAENE